MRGSSLEGVGVIDKVADYSGVKFPSNAIASMIRKAPTTSKRDIMINGIGVSLKSLRGAAFALVNHTTREKWLRVCSRLNLNISPLDEMVEDYWDLRLAGKIGEDIKSKDLLCPFGNTPERKSYLKPLIDYFLFEGTGGGDSPYPAQRILEFESTEDPDTWKILDRNSAYERIWKGLRFSIRSKAMPAHYAEMKDGLKKDEIAPWVRHIDGKYRGALHIRFDEVRR